MLTAHRRLGDYPGTYRRGWEIVDGDLAVVITVMTRAEAKRIVKAQDVGLRLRLLSAEHDSTTKTGRPGA